MTRATLLHVLERPTALGPAEVRELEQLAQAFPYCQTAHLLLAKAAHDQGTMLAGQRLRRAATYAADRTLLRRLIEQQEPAAAPAPAGLPIAPHPLDLVDWPDEYVPPTAAPVVAAPVPVAAGPPAPTPVAPPVAFPVAISISEADFLAAAADIITPTVTVASLDQVVALPGPTLAPIAAPLPTPGTPPESALPAPLPVPAAVEPVVALPDLPVARPVITIPALTTAAEAAAATAPVAPGVPSLPAAAAETPVTDAVEPATAAIADVAAPVAAVTPLPEPLAKQLPATPEITVAAPVTEALPVPADKLPEAELPAQAPAIRPPVEVGEARFEFGLADPAPAVVVTTYELPSLVDEWAASAVTRSLGSPKALAPTRPAPVVPVFTPAAFTGDTVVGYGYGESSRLGLSLQLLDLLTVKAETAESTTAVVAAAQPPAGPLPPTGTFFEPDPLLLDHWATHRPATPELPTTLDLINNFLKRQPRLTRPAMLPPSATHQADLSVRSTRAEPDLVSENLARIFVRQGKTARAIEIYEKLMVKQPEKMAYFAHQIQSLRPTA